MVGNRENTNIVLFNGILELEITLYFTLMDCDSLKFPALFVSTIMKVLINFFVLFFFFNTYIFLKLEYSFFYYERGLIGRPKYPPILYLTLAPHNSVL